MASSPLLALALEGSVPFAILALQRRGGPDDADWQAARDFAWVLATDGDQLLYNGNKPGDTARLFGMLSAALATLAFAPGGVDLFGLHWEAASPGQEEPTP